MVAAVCDTLLNAADAVLVGNAIWGTSPGTCVNVTVNEFPPEPQRGPLVPALAVTATPRMEGSASRADSRVAGVASKATETVGSS